MADIIIEPLVGAIVEKAVSLAFDFIKQEYNLLYNVKDEMSKLSSNLSAIQAVLKDAERKVRSLSEPKSQQIHDWLGKLKDAALDAEDILETCATKAKTKKKHGPRRLWSLRDDAKKIKGIAGRIEHIAQERKNFHLEETRDDIVSTIGYQLQETGFFRDISEICGRQDEKEEIMSWLLSEESDVEGEVVVLPIVGMPGLGKTTLAQFIYNDERIKSHFHYKLWVSVTIHYDADRIGKEIIESVTEMKHELTAWSSIQKRILEVLGGRRFLLVLDDVWNDSFRDWARLREMLKQGGRGSRVLITSRNSTIKNTVGALRTHNLDYLPPGDCWALFANIAFVGGHSLSSERMKDLEDIGRQIVQKCNGLPLAVCAMACLLRGEVNVRKWKSILNNGVWEAEQAEDRDSTILPALKLSYDHLPPHLKQCFEYCSVFPKGYMFDKHELVKLWMSQGFLKPSGQYTLEEVGINYFKHLLGRFFFRLVSNDNQEIYKMHDLNHDLAVLVARHYHQVKDNCNNAIPQDCRHVSFLGKDVHQSILGAQKATKLRTLISPVGYHRNFGQGLEEMLQALKYLRTLDLSSSTIAELPKSIGKLNLLSYLDLSNTDIRNLPSSTCKLINLQTLKLLGCPWLLALPIDLGNLKNLRRLELDKLFWYKHPSLPPRLGSLTSLQTLHSFRVGKESGYGVQELERMKLLTGPLHISNLENTTNPETTKLEEKEDLQALVLEWSIEDQNPLDGTMQERALDQLRPHRNLSKIQIHGFIGSRFPSWMSTGSITNLSEISLAHCDKCSVLSLGHLHNLRKLHIKGMKELGEWSEMSYPSLSWLQVSKCPKLRKLPSVLVNLRVMKIKCCHMLQDLPLTPLLQFLTLVDNINLEDWKERLVGLEGTNAQGEVQRGLRWSFLGVLEMKVVNSPRLRGLPQYFCPQKLEISGCSLFSTLPPPDHSCRLQHLALDRCDYGTLVEAIPSTDSMYSLVISNIAGLTSLPTGMNLPGLRALYIHDCRDLESLSSASWQPLVYLESLELLYVSGCPNLATLPNGMLPTRLKHLSVKRCLNLRSLGTQDSLVRLTSLEDLYLEDCAQIMNLPADGLPSSLKHCCVLNCPLLTQRYNEGGACRQMMAQIPDLEIDTF